ncbi:bifunctional 2-polyprenyl-6-hydroxyphenol methylase/3-demethylubiquinol 3-O-methyltransferase UbiG [Roseomonas sp. 18066]|uniref:class I SAM-dependent methyltransferase n=1 Tax=Roseomonas sp. 18066 TaxID=2681412 RepID=UPI00135A0110|nr:class I SAM-dependent methyltransferase [Roseomonas sp. 18066]
MAQNIYDDPGFFAGYSQLNRSLHGLDGAPEWPAIQALLPPMAGKRVVDLGCGFGWFSRWAAAQGAAGVLGIDLSARMLARARAETSHPAIAYQQADLETLELEEARFDLAYSALAFHYLADFPRLVATVHRALAPGGHFVFTIEHPIYMASTRPGWLARDDGAHAWALDHYAVEGPRETDWLAPGVIKQHRRMATTVNALIAAGFTLAALDEWAPSPAQLAAQPALQDEVERPMMLLVSARRG